MSFSTASAYGYIYLDVKIFCMVKENSPFTTKNSPEGYTEGILFRLG